MKPTNCLTCQYAKSFRIHHKTGPKLVDCTHPTVIRKIAELPGNARELTPPSWCPRKEDPTK